MMLPLLYTCRPCYEGLLDLNIYAKVRAHTYLTLYPGKQLGCH